MFAFTTSPELTAELSNANRIEPSRTLESERVRVSTLMGVWLLIPLALGALAFILNGMFLVVQARFSDDPAMFEINFADFNVTWLVLTMILQVAYWCLLSRPWYYGFWAVVPVIGLLPTFFLARQCLQRPTPTRVSPSDL
jgi:hypothetical protein